MASRKLTKRFFSYNLGKWEKKTGKAALDLLDVGNLEINKIAEIIMLGNVTTKDSEQDMVNAYEILDNYLMDDENSIIDAYMDCIDELDRDLKILKACGMSMEDIRAQFDDAITSGKDKLTKSLDKAADIQADVNEDDNKIIDIASINN